MSTEQDQNVDSNPDSPTDPNPEDYAWTRITDRSECRPALEELKDQVNSLLDDIDSDIAYVKKRLIKNKFVNYDEFLDYIFPNGTFNATSVPSHTECMNLKKEVIEMDELFLRITELGSNISHSMSYNFNATVFSIPRNGSDSTSLQKKETI